MKNISVEVWFYRVNNERLDKKLDIKTDSFNKQIFDVKDFVKGKWKVSVDWQSENKKYLDDKDHATLSTFLPSMASTTSPCLIPAFSAGE
ncbi:MAG TPA: hypothetical protein ENK96_09075 [Desulfobulbaceae bacterium]|nr:hypothetical protein [Desulfobulbaceae bacterium]